MHAFLYSFHIYSLNIGSIFFCLQFKCKPIFFLYFINRVCPDHVTILTKVHEIVTSLPTHGCHGFSLIYHGNNLNQLGNFSLVLPSLVIASSMGWGAPDIMVNISLQIFGCFNYW